MLLVSTSYYMYFSVKKDGSDQILAAAFSTHGRYFAISDDHKQLSIWDVHSGWKQVNTRYNHVI
jgi:hypothetical protein